MWLDPGAPAAMRSLSPATVRKKQLTSSFLLLLVRHFALVPSGVLVTNKGAWAKLLCLPGSPRLLFSPFLHPAVAVLSKSLVAVFLLF